VFTRAFIDNCAAVFSKSGKGVVRRGKESFCYRSGFSATDDLTLAQALMILGEPDARELPTGVGGKQLRYVRRMCDSGLAQEPPRRTYLLHMNLPLHSPNAPAVGE
jgi:hypothetical protein